MKEDNSFVNGVLLGGVIGVVLGVMLAPGSGKQTREMMVEKLHDLKEHVASAINSKVAGSSPKKATLKNAKSKVKKKTVKKKAKSGK